MSMEHGDFLARDLGSVQDLFEETVRQVAAGKTEAKCF
jgi:hypothetical protein